MKQIFLFFSALLLANISGYSQQTLLTTKSNETLLETTKIHPNAKKVLKSDFYWNDEDPNNPFITNKMTNTFRMFELWRQHHENETPVNFLPKYSTNEMSLYRNEISPDKIKEIYTNLYNDQKKIIDGDSEILVKIELSPSDINKASQAQKEAIIEKTVKQDSYISLIEEDNLIIAVGFGQFALEGRIDNELKMLTEKALIRQLDPFVLGLVSNNENIAVRKNDLALMLQDLKSIN